MRILLIHSDYLKYKTKSKTKIAEKIDDIKKEGVFENALVVFTAVEKEDESDMETVVENAINEIKEVYGKVGAEIVAIYPYAHLSSSLSSPEAAKKVLGNIESGLDKMGINVKRVPFGWYKSFEISCKGHPLSELSRTITADKRQTEKTNEKKSESAKSEFYILDKKEIIKTEKFNFQKNDLKKLVDYELGRMKSSGEEPPHVKLMREKNLADYEPSADIGHLRWYPKGRLIRDLLSDYVYNLVTERGAMPVETPIMYDLSDDAIRVHAEKFGERQYRMATKNKELMLRYACCFGAFRILSDSFLTWKNLPVGIYELSTYSFRLEKKGEVVGLKRLRGFTMPDLHTVCVDIDQAMVEFDKQITMCKQTGIDLDVNYEVIMRATREFLEENKDWVYSASNKIGKPILLEILPERKHYWVAKMDFAAIDYLGRPIENPTIQIDVESGERFGITFINSKEEEVNPIIIHCSPTGSIERVICSLLEKSAVDRKDKPPMLPVWLIPTQVRIIPIAERHTEKAEQIAQQLKHQNIRVDIDDRHETVGKKIRNAGGEWAPYVIVIGDKELEGGPITINIRETNEKLEMKIVDLVEKIHNETKDMPFRKLPLPVKLANRVSF
jgi:threonyl-tRNA synthetase